MILFSIQKLLVNVPLTQFQLFIVDSLIKKRYSVKVPNNIIHTQLIPKLSDSLKRYIALSASTPDITPY